MQRAYIGVDVGTGSARAGVFDAAGRLLGSAKHPIRMWREAGDVVEQSSDDIWAACVAAVHGAMAESGVEAAAIAGIGFDATCSLVVLDADLRPVTVSPSADPARNVIVWMDHRAMAETDRLNATGHAVLAHVGGQISPEMETPKLLWLKTHLPESWARAAHFLDLSDFLTLMATGDLARSTCTVTCKWTYLAHENRWADDFFHAGGLGDLADEGHARIGTRIVDPGVPLGSGLTEAAARTLGLRPGIPVGAALIDAHAGGVGTIGGQDAAGAPVNPESRIAFIMGTSACAMAVAAAPRFVDGVWGPYYSAMVPGLWLTEGGQSAAGAAVDRIVAMHPAHAALKAEAAAAGIGLLELLERELTAAAPSLAEAAYAAANLHVVPDLLGNRSPFADPDMRGLIAGLDLDDGRDGVAKLYAAVLCGLSYGAAQILDALEAAGYGLETVVMSGGASHSPLVRQIMADATGRRVALPETAEPVLLGAAMLGAMAAGDFPDMGAAMAAMSRDGAETLPAGGAVAAFHAKKRAVFELLQTAEGETRRLMRG
ncbi:FGGY-family carbohydrate kinase [Methylobrevis albus]|uniref:FGGY-family carbohydrate kinase n=1 Tax=Methylobrevis albus TaxID=2793297 RepID=A0A931I0U2_9HYPH|nr:FGGY-family carbohydrate kinase [Methylobrevis albus]MBH0238095.1 FGGY-family carbohydrate kinase [Methylobrevis albus]